MTDPTTSSRTGALEPSDSTAERGPRPWPARLLGELRAHIVGYAVLAAFTLAGPAVVYFLFPDAPIILGVIGGFVFGAYAALCAVPDQFF